ncbi:outer membrane beta-barrel protein [Myxococcota bacterium]|nr:outer membrane beta-barrel protein [Myxococcota bacterium]
MRGGLAVLALATVLAILASGAPAFAQEAADDDVGLRVGAARFQPGISLTTIYDSNVYRSDSTKEWDFIQVVAPRLRFVYPGADNYFLVGAQYHLRKYFGLGTGEDDEIGHRDLDTYDNFGVDLRVDGNRRGKVSPTFNLLVRNRAQVLDSAEWPALADSNMYHFGLGADLGVRIRPRSAFSITPGLAYELADHRTGTTGTRERWATGHDVTGRLGVEWRFLPKTALRLDFEVGGLSWSFRPTDNAELQQLIVEASQVDPEAARLLDLTLYDSQHWRLWFGLQGRFSRKLAVQALFGYANVYFPDDPNTSVPESRAQLTGADGILGRVQVHLRPADTQIFTIGFVRDYEYTYFSNYYISSSPYVRYQGIFGGRVDARASASYSYREIFGDISRTDHQVDALAGVGVRVTSWFEPWLEYTLLAVPKSTDENVSFATHTAQIRLELGF